MTQDDASKDAILTRQLLREELDASNSYEGKAGASADPNAKALYNDISREEKVHAGELSQLLSEQDPDGAKAQQEGMREAEGIVKSAEFDVIEAFGFTKSSFGDAITKAGFNWKTGNDMARTIRGTMAREKADPTWAGDPKMLQNYLNTMEQMAKQYETEFGQDTVSIPDEPVDTWNGPIDLNVKDMGVEGRRTGIPQQYADISINADKDKDVMKSNDAERLADGFEAVIKSSMQKATPAEMTGRRHKFIDGMKSDAQDIPLDVEAGVCEDVNNLTGTQNWIDNAENAIQDEYLNGRDQNNSSNIASNRRGAEAVAGSSGIGNATKRLDIAHKLALRDWDKLPDLVKQSKAGENAYNDQMMNGLEYARTNDLWDDADFFNAVDMGIFQNIGKSEEFSICDIMPSFEDDLNARIQKNNEMGNFSVAKTDAIKGAWKYSDLRINEQIDFSAKKAPTKEDGMSVKDVKVGPKKKD